MSKSRGAHWFLVGKPERRNHLEDPGLDRRIILKWIFEKWDGEELDRCGPRQGQVTGVCESGDEPLGSKKCR
jgi:hypothetical protein